MATNNTAGCTLDFIWMAKYGSMHTMETAQSVKLYYGHEWLAHLKPLKADWAQGSISSMGTRRSPGCRPAVLTAGVLTSS